MIIWICSIPFFLYDPVSILQGSCKFIDNMHEHAWGSNAPVCGKLVENNSPNATRRKQLVENKGRKTRRVVFGELFSTSCFRRVFLDSNAPYMSIHDIARGPETSSFFQNGFVPFWVPWLPIRFNKSRQIFELTILIRHIFMLTNKSKKSWKLFFGVTLILKNQTSPPIFPSFKVV